MFDLVAYFILFNSKLPKESEYQVIKLLKYSRSSVQFAIKRFTETLVLGKQGQNGHKTYNNETPGQKTNTKVCVAISAHQSLLKTTF